jgi:hypothetical protein
MFNPIMMSSEVESICIYKTSLRELYHVMRIYHAKSCVRDACNRLTIPMAQLRILVSRSKTTVKPSVSTCQNSIIVFTSIFSVYQELLDDIIEFQDLSSIVISIGSILSQHIVYLYTMTLKLYHGLVPQKLIYLLEQSIISKQDSLVVCKDKTNVYMTLIHQSKTSEC